MTCLRLKITKIWSVQSICDLHFSGSELAKIAIVVSAHLHVEHLGFSSLRVGDQNVSEQREHILADLVQLSFNHLAVLVDQLNVLASLISLTILNG